MTAPLPATDALASILAELQALRADLARASSPFLTTAEVAALLGTSEEWVCDSAFDVAEPWERCQRYHVLPGRKVARRWVFHRDLIAQYVRGEYVRPDAPAPVAIRKRVG